MKALYILFFNAVGTILWKREISFTARIIGFGTNILLTHDW